MMKVLLAIWSIVLFTAFTTASTVEDLADETQNKILSRGKRQVCPTITFPCSSIPNVCANIRNATNLGKPTRLNRITDPKLIRKNRRDSGCPKLVKPTGYSCDEYPFASSRQGGQGAVIKSVPARENSIQGGLLSAFYKSHDIGDGDCFNVAITGFGRSKYH